MPTSADYAARAVEVAARIAEAERRKSPDQRRLEQAWRDARRFQYLEKIELGQAATRRKLQGVRYIG